MMLILLLIIIVRIIPNTNKKIRLGNQVRRSEFGNLVGLKPSPSSNLNFTTITTPRLRKHHINNNNKTKTIKISEPLFQRFLDHSRKYYNVEPYETIIEDLLDCYEKHNQDKHWYNNTDLNK